jgi:hypothetical protein
MKTRICIAVVAIASMAAGAFGGQEKPFKVEGNPIFRNMFTADPAAMVDGDTLYVYAGQDEASLGGWFKMNNWVCYSTKDMLDWNYEGVVLSCSDFPWGSRGSAWACQVAKKNGKYYFYSTSGRQNGKGLTVGIAVSDKPTGPFKDVKGAPLFDNAITTGNRLDSMEDIDPTVFIDDDGQAYIYWGNGKLHYALLSDDMMSLKDLNGDGKLTEGEDVFTDVAIKDKVGSYGEAPWLYKANGKYYLVYASELPQYVRYAMSDSPCGPWKYAGVILNPNRYPDGRVGPYNSDTCHPAVIAFKGQTYIFYHDSALPTGGQTRRSVCVERMFYNPDGTIKQAAKTSTGLAGTATRIQSSRQKDRFATYSGYSVTMGNGKTDSEAYPWEFVKGLLDGAAADMVSIQPVSFPGYYLTVNGHSVVLAKNDDSEEFKKRATFRTVPGLADRRGVSFQLTEDRQQYIRQNDSNGILETVAVPTNGSSSKDRQDATFNVLLVR